MNGCELLPFCLGSDPFRCTLDAPEKQKGCVYYAGSGWCSHNFGGLDDRCRSKAAREAAKEAYHAERKKDWT